MNIKINNFTVNFKGVVVKLSSWLTAELSPRFTFIYHLVCINLFTGTPTRPSQGRNCMNDASGEI